LACLMDIEVMNHKSAEWWIGQVISLYLGICAIGVWGGVAGTIVIYVLFVLVDIREYIKVLAANRKNKMRIVPLTLSQANALVEKLHRHHKKCQGHRFSLGLFDDNKPFDEIIGAVIVGRPVARACSQYDTAEVTRLVTDGTKNACSMLYGAAARVCKEMGFKKIQTYILEEEFGSSLKASGWVKVGETDAKGWNCKTRNGRREDQPMCKKHRYERILNDNPPTVSTIDGRDRNRESTL
jgi:hypothetical protein